MAEFSLCLRADVRFQLHPKAAIILNFLALSAEKDQPFQGLAFPCRLFKLSNKLLSLDSI